MEGVRTKERQEMICGNVWLVREVAGRYSGMQNEDLFSVGAIGLIKAVDTFDIRKTDRLAPYAWRCIENEICSYLRKQRRAGLIPLEAGSGKDGTEMELTGETWAGPQEAVEQEDELCRLRTLVGSLPQEDRRLIELRFLGEETLSQEKTAKMLGVTQSAVSRREKKILRLLREGLS